MDRSIYLGFTVLELSKLIKYETNYDKLQLYFAEKDLHLHYKETDSFVLNVNTYYIIKALENLQDLFDFSTLNENHELFSKKSNR